jgi:endonuclease/exonuclease/phosphatase family metal-dependent hydrolase
VVPAIPDPIDAPAGSAVDLGAIRIQDDPDYLHLTLETGRDVNAQSMRGTVHLVFDADGDEATGDSLFGMAGVDADVLLSRTDNPSPDGFGAGVGVRLLGRAGLGDVESGYRVGALIAPTYSASHFEIRIRRDNGPRGPTLFGGAAMRMRAVFDENGAVLDHTDVAAYSMRSPVRSKPVVPPVTDIGQQDGTFRVTAWNVAFTNFLDRPDVFRRILAALDPDVIMLDEVHGSVTEAYLETFFATEPLGSPGEWGFVLGRGGGRQKNVVASRLPIRPEESLLEIMYGPGALDALEREIGDPRFARLYELERGRGLAAAGAWVEVLGQEVLFVPVDLQSAGYDGSAQDRLRELQATTLNERVGDVLRSATDKAAVVIAGDLNLVGSIRPLWALSAGLDDGGALSVADAYRLADRSQVTWRDPRLVDPFTPGRLDFVLFSGARLEAVRAFPFDADELPDAVVQELGLESDDSRATSDHLVVVADLRWRQ